MRVVVEIDELGQLGALLDHPKLAAEKLRLIIGRSPSLVDVIGAAAVEPPTGDELQRELLDLVSPDDWIGTAELVRAVGAKRDAVLRALKELEAGGKVEHRVVARAYEWRTR